MKVIKLGFISRFLMNDDDVCQFKKTNLKKRESGRINSLRVMVDGLSQQLNEAAVRNVRNVFLKIVGLNAMNISKHAEVKDIIVEKKIISSEILQREVETDIYLPSKIHDIQNTELLLINDGQDLPRMPVPFQKMLRELIHHKKIRPLLCVGIYCGEDRMNEYGTANRLDYKGRGTKAAAYTQFIFEELLPLLHERFHINSFKAKSFAGFSMGALSALDIVWNHPNEFSKVGVFSGSLWWRSKSYEDGYDEHTDRIMHQQIRNGEYQPQLKFFIECGTADETEDRNKNGIIDSIDDAMELIKELKNKGYKDEDIMYIEIPEGKHDVPTWAKAFPSFLKWGWGTK